MNEIIEYEPTNPQISVYSDINLYEQFLKMAEGLSKTEVVPESYRNKPEACLIALDVARQIGCKNPLFVMQNLYVVKGKPSWSGQYCAAIVRANFDNVHIEWKGKDDEAGYGCRVVAQDKNGNDCNGTWVTMKMVKEEGWLDKVGSKWRTMPVLMLQYRAFAFFARIHCPEKLLGMYDEFEHEDIRSAKSVEAENLTETLLAEANNN
jgi:hypothetical protein